MKNKQEPLSLTYFLQKNNTAIIFIPVTDSKMDCGGNLNGFESYPLQKYFYNFLSRNSSSVSERDGSTIHGALKLKGVTGLPDKSPIQQQLGCFTKLNKLIYKTAYFYEWGMLSDKPVTPVN